MSIPVLNIKGKKSRSSLNDLYGIFFEDLNHAADGGLYAEMVQNRSFEFEALIMKIIRQRMLGNLTTHRSLRFELISHLMRITNTI
ncbi:hypothetical protein NIE88_19300 [Sporolactobacillus shoreicorticis]|uniref:Uncharacterized protein n=1 Tax=Sporolactobacillus shoreicorticis TaxID=1923877 RepID=A0ABW5S9N8_9BACL|nr:hypothetical protein [Sporolactobacillus shoreicorticis]MCO7127894.1 hypothetical protein [Sporolactobacillus shoreicorticis]